VVEIVWQGEDYEIIINSAGRRHCRDRDTGVFVDMEECLEERERLEEKKTPPKKIPPMKIPPKPMPRMALSGSQVVSKHKAAIGRCSGKIGWAALKCIVNAMHRQYT